MKLPYSESLPIGYLSRIFDNMNQSYKIFWFWAILDQVYYGKSEISFIDLIHCMIAKSWYMVTEYKLNLGPVDTMESLIKEVYADGKNGIFSNAKEYEIINFLEIFDDKSFKKKRSALCQNVPYRMHAPFLNDIKAQDWNQRGVIIEKINSNYQLVYAISYDEGINRRVIMNPKWISYMKSNYEILTAWIEYNLIMYLQKRNPSVPGISNKIKPPQERKLEKVSRYWRAMVEVSSITNVYSDTVMTIEDISIDHFIPWSFVTHDELWNLVPTTRSINSSKSNRLPEWDTYFEKLLNVEYEAKELRTQYNKINQLFQECRKHHVNDDDVWMKLYQRDMSKTEFGNNLRDIMLPVYLSAKNLGFSEWIYEK